VAGLDANIIWLVQLRFCGKNFGIFAGVKENFRLISLMENHYELDTVNKLSLLRFTLKMEFRNFGILP
jgi:hypothetical protein